MTQNDIPEAVSSVTYSLIDPDGFPILFTVRDTSGEDLLKRMESINRTLKEKGYKPQVRGYPPKKEAEIVEGRKCPECGSDLTKGVTKTGKRYIQCSKRNYDFKTKTITGCQFIEWEQ